MAGAPLALLCSSQVQTRATDSFKRQNLLVRARRPAAGGRL